MTSRIIRLRRGVMELNLTDEEAVALRELLDRHVTNMYAEISHTDKPAFRAQMRDARSVLQGIRAKLD